MVGEVNGWLVGVGRLLHPEALAPVVRHTPILFPSQFYNSKIQQLSIWN